jgi:hypothetical protein
MRTADPLDLVRAANPVPRGTLDALAAERAEELLARLRSDQIGSPTRPNTFGHKVGSSQAPVSRFARRPVMAVAALAIAAVIAGSALAISTGTFGLFGGSRVTDTQFSSNGQYNLSNMGGGTPITHTVFLIGTRAGVSFYRVHRADGTNCWAAGNAGATPDVTSAACPPDGQSFAFPSAKQPVLDFSEFVATGTPANRADSVPARLAGLAADAVASVALVDASGRVVDRTPVVGNIYATTDLSKKHASQLVAFDAQGHQIYRQCLDRGCQP